MRQRFWFLAGALSVFVSFPCSAQQRAGRLESLVDSVAQAELRISRAPGMVVAVIRADSVVYRKAFGLANVDTGEPMSPDMMLSVASVSKLVTAVTATTLAATGKLSLTAPISTYLPWIVPELGTLTMSQLLSHTAGLGERTPAVTPGSGGAVTPVCRAMSAQAIVAPAGATWGYSNTGYTIAGCVIEAVTNVPYPQAVAQTVLRPIGMNRSTYNPLVAMTYPHAQGHDTRNDTTVVVRPFNSNPSIAPAGELITTVDDLARLAAVLLADGRAGERVALPRGILTELTRVRGHGGALLGGQRDYGFGLFVRSHNGLQIAEHEGIYAGFGASVAFIEARGLAAIAVSNGRYSPPMRTTQAALEVAAGLSPSSITLPTSSVATADSVAAVGRYVATGDTLEIGPLDGRLVVRRGSRVQSIVARSNDLWSMPGYPAYLPIPETPLELVMNGPHRHVEFIRIGWRVYRRVE